MHTISLKIKQNYQLMWTNTERNEFAFKNLQDCSIPNVIEIPLFLNIFLKMLTGCTFSIKYTNVYIYMNLYRYTYTFGYKIVLGLNGTQNIFRLK